MKVLLIDNYDSFTYNLFHYISKFNCEVDVIRNDKIKSKDIIKNKYKKIVISPGPGNPSQAGNCLKIVKDIHKDFSILGVCLGHQIIGQAFGAKIIRARKLMHGKMSKIYFKKMIYFKIFTLHLMQLGIIVLLLIENFYQTALLLQRKQKIK